MLDKADLISTASLFAKSRPVRAETRAEFIALARRVAKSLRKEKERLAKEQQEIAFTSGLFSFTEI